MKLKAVAVLMIAVLGLVSACTLRAQTTQQVVSDVTAVRVQLTSWSNSVGTNALADRLQAVGLNAQDSAVLSTYAEKFAKEIKDDAALPREQENGENFVAVLDNLANSALRQLSKDGNSHFIKFLYPRKASMRLDVEDVMMNTHQHLVPVAFHPGRVPSGAMPGGITTHYTSYLDVWESSDGSTIYAQENINGYTHCTINSPYCTSGSHQPIAHVVLNGQGGTVYGTSAYPGNYIQASSTAVNAASSLPNPSQGTVWTQVQCSWIGTAIYGITGGFPLEIANTTSIDVAGSNPTKMGPNCTAATTPPDWVGVINPPPGDAGYDFLGFAWMWRWNNSGPWTFVGSAIGGGAWIEPPTKAERACTYNP